MPASWLKWLWWVAGGDGDWRRFLTLPNILRAMSPNLTGYSVGKADFLSPVSALNVAFPISAGEDASTQAQTLVGRMKRLLGTSYSTDWKVSSPSATHFTALLLEPIPHTSSHLAP